MEITKFLYICLISSTYIVLIAGSMISPSLLDVQSISNCTPQYSPGFSNTSICTEIYQQENGWWLPEAYQINAQCACETLPINSGPADCIRQFLYNKLSDSNKYSLEFKQTAADMKTKYNQNQLGDLFQYKNYVLTVFTPLIYQDHVDAYESNILSKNYFLLFLECCCVGTPAPYIDWEMVATIPLYNCQLIQVSVDIFGSCSGTPGQW